MWFLSCCILFRTNCKCLFRNRKIWTSWAGLVSAGREKDSLLLIRWRRLFKKHTQNPFSQELHFITAMNLRSIGGPEVKSMTSIDRSKVSAWHYLLHFLTQALAFLTGFGFSSLGETRKKAYTGDPEEVRQFRLLQQYNSSGALPWAWIKQL